jgi:hypothetical protein
MSDDCAAMPRYVSHKRVWGLEIAEVGLRDFPSGDRRLSFRDNGFDPIVAPGEMFARYVPVPGDFYVVYADGYKSFSPRRAFLEGYEREGGAQRNVSPGLDAAISDELRRRPADIAGGGS